MSTPSVKLADLILERLLKEKLLTTEDAINMRDRLANGKVRAEDWRLAIEKGADKGGR